MKPPEVAWIRVAPGGWHIRKVREDREMELEDMTVTRKMEVTECGEVIPPTAMSSVMYAKPHRMDKFCPDCTYKTICSIS